MTKMSSALSTLFRSRQGARWRTVLLALVVLFLSFAVGFRLFFPVDVLKQRLQSELSRRAGAQISLQDLSLGLPLSLELQGLSVQSRQPALPAFDINTIEMAPTWLSLVSGDPGIDVRAELYDGDLDLNLARSGRFDMDLSGLRLDRLPALSVFDTPVKLAGTASGQISASAPPLSNRSDTVIALRIDNAAVTGLEPLGVAEGRVRLGNVTAQGEMHGRKLTVEKIMSAGGDVRINGKGNLLIGSDPARTRLNLQVDLLPESSLDPMLRDLLSLSGSKPAPDGSYSFRLSGSLARPMLR